MLVPGKGCQRLTESDRNFVHWSFGEVVVVALAVVIADAGAVAVVTAGMQLPELWDVGFGSKAIGLVGLVGLTELIGVVELAGLL
jgi:hypothetical protein